MNLIRLIALAALFWLLYRLILALLRKMQPPAVPSDTTGEGLPMVCCEVCGLHVPRPQALERGGRYYCCEAHRDAADSWRRDGQ